MNWKNENILIILSILILAIFMVNTFGVIHDVSRT